MTTYTPPKVWTWDAKNGGQFESINRPIAGPTHDKDLPVGKHPIQLHSLATPNGVKVTVLLEELRDAGHDVEYDAWYVDINAGDQFSSGFVDLNPNSKIPALFDKSAGVRVFESGAILLYLAEKYRAFLPDDIEGRTETLNWLFWLQGAAPFLGGGFGHFFAYAPEKFEYAINRYTMEVKRQLDVLDQALEDNTYLAGSAYTIADIATAPWYGTLVRGNIYGDAGTFLDAASYQNVRRWADLVMNRPAFKRGRMVNRGWGEPQEQLRERHAASDFDNRTQDKLDSE